LRIAIYGVGGAGGYFGARLAQAGVDVVWVARGAQLEALKHRGLDVESVHGDLQLGPLRASSDPAELGQVDAVILGVKVWQVREAAQGMRPLLVPDACVVPLQNGVEAADDLRSVLGDGPPLGGVAKIISELVAPGRIRHLGGPSSLAFGELDDRPSKRVERLRAVLRSAGMAVDAPSSILAALWEKFLFVASLGGVGAVSRAPFGVLRSVPETRAMLEEAMVEIRDLALARGVRLAPDVVQRSLDLVDQQPPAGTTSLQRDLTAGRRSELEWWSGAVVRLGLASGIPTPVHRFMYQSLLPGELRASGRIEYPPQG
jgi:2-dehydropantoate 2-reductase